jgi:hypothetical protein
LAGCVPDFEFDDSIWEGDFLGEEGGWKRKLLADGVVREER